MRRRNIEPGDKTKDERPSISKVNATGDVRPPALHFFNAELFITRLPMGTKKKVDKQMSSYGKKGPIALREKLGEEGYRAHMRKIAKRGAKMRRAAMA